MGQSGALAGMQAFIVTQYHAGVITRDDNGTIITPELTSAAIQSCAFLFAAFAANVAVMLVSTAAVIRIAKGVKGAGRRRWWVSCMETAVRAVFFVGKRAPMHFPCLFSVSNVMSCHGSAFPWDP
jgi:hypothetical protein